MFEGIKNTVLGKTFQIFRLEASAQSKLNRIFFRDGGDVLTDQPHLKLDSEEVRTIEIVTAATVFEFGECFNFVDKAIRNTFRLNAIRPVGGMVPYRLRDGIILGLFRGADERDRAQKPFEFDKELLCLALDLVWVHGENDAMAEAGEFSNLVARYCQNATMKRQVAIGSMLREMSNRLEETPYFASQAAEAFAMELWHKGTSCLPLTQRFKVMGELLEREECPVFTEV